ncbi:NUDIX hydrolase [uncultured Ruminococcus sp.]|jgi:ADP-ribose pyrophosphatase YjhB (NUDIX family)|uniref:NUDIX domain-containing protein n=1 Tax=uncultured Ruminococcus sp. TaxID=165186 RepID=UPI0025CC4A39|nr:NUDIX hydrolase [uncultured Ruminococcus sp.]
MSNRFYAVCGIVDIGGKILFVRHTYGPAKERILIPGGYVKEGELPSDAVKRELFEETGVNAAAESVFAVQFRAEQWIIVFRLKYISGEPHSDGYENSEVLLLTPEEAVKRTDITNMSRAILNAYINARENTLEKGDYKSISLKTGEYEIFGV